MVTRWHVVGINRYHFIGRQSETDDRWIEDNSIRGYVSFRQAMRFEHEMIILNVTSDNINCCCILKTRLLETRIWRLESSATHCKPYWWRSIMITTRIVVFKRLKWGVSAIDGQRKRAFSVIATKTIELHPIIDTRNSLSVGILRWQNSIPIFVKFAFPPWILSQPMRSDCLHRI